MMPLRTTALALSLLTASVARAQGTRPDAVLLRFPDVSATEIVFRYDGDLWLVPKEGGTARRVTSGPGDEDLAKFSPDGHRLAFEAGYDGGRDLYVLDVDGGVPQRVTYHPAPETLCDWHPDGERLLFFSSETAGIARAPQMFLVPVDGAQPQPLALPYGSFGSIDPATGWLAYTPNSREFRTWRRYRGGMAQDVWLFHPDTLESRRLTDDPGTDSMPMWHDGRLVFLSDRGPTGIANLWSMTPDGGDLRQLTDLGESGARFPSMGPDDVVFELGGKLRRYSFADGTVHAVDVSIPMDRPRLRPVHRDLSSALDEVHASPSGKRAVGGARGDVFTMPVGDGAPRNLTRTSGVAERSPSWSPDGQWIAYWSDRSGEYELTLRRADGATFEGADEHGEQQVTMLGAGWKFDVSWAPDSRKLAFSMQAGELYLLDLDTKEQVRIDKEPAGGPVAVDWAPDSGWLAWSREGEPGGLPAIHLYDVRERRLHRVTSGMFSDGQPCFDLKGDWLFFTSARDFQPTYSELDTTWIYQDTTKLLAVPLRAGVANPWAPRDAREEAPAEVPAEAAQETPEGGPKEGGRPVAATEVAPLVIELEGFEARAIEVPLDAHDVRALDGIPGGVAFLRAGGGRRGAGRGPGGGELFVYDLAQKKESKVLDGVRGFELSPDGERALVRTADGWAVVAAKPGAKIEDDARVDASGVAGTYDPRAEWRQMIHDVYRIYRDWFYDPGMHGVDWKGVRDRALAALDDATSRGDVGFLIGEMISELNVGHAYNRPGPDDANAGPDGPSVGFLGCDWALEEGAYRIARVLGSEYDTDERSPLSVPGVDARAGDWLLAVDGVPVDASRAVCAALVGCADRETVLTLNARPVRDGNERDVVVRPLRREGGLRYRDWVARKREAVHAATGGRVGYVHVPSTGIDGQNELVRQFMAEYHRDALIVDERWNSGGQIPTRFIELLNRPLTNAWATRAERSWAWPPVGHRGPKAMLINYAAGSGGDAFPYYFREAGLGKLIGTRTWGGLVGLSGNPGLIDGASPSVPTFGFYELDGTWGVEGHGVEPDIEVLDDPTAGARGGDPQLERAISELLGELATWSPPTPPRPAAPDRKGAGLPESDK